MRSPLYMLAIFITAAIGLFPISVAIGIVWALDGFLQRPANALEEESRPAEYEEFPGYAEPKPAPRPGKGGGTGEGSGKIIVLKHYRKGGMQ